PLGESSIASASWPAIPKKSRTERYKSGAGLACVTSSTVRTH
ncbi:MAG: hypothetical protein AMXMBFR75_31760, partial [Candidatus Hinthialibacteria bacterium]